MSSVWSRGVLFLNRTDSGFGLFVLGVIVPIPLHTRNIMPICSSVEFKFLAQEILNIFDKYD